MSVIGLPGFVLLGCVLFVFAARGLHPIEQKFVWWGLFAHLLSSVVQMILHEYVYGGDMHAYLASGEVLAAFMERDFLRYAPDVLDLTLQRSKDVPVVILGSESTWTMYGLAGFGLYFLGSAWALSLAWAFASVLGKLALYHAVRGHFGPAERKGVLIACFLIPSVVFWTSTFMKEAVAFVGLGLLVYALSRLEQRRFGVAMTAAAPGFLVVSLVKPYILLALVLSAAAWFYAARLRGRVRPLRLIGAMMIGAAGLFLLGELFPRYGMSSIVDQAVLLQGAGPRVDGGSNYQIVDSPAETLLGQFAFAPLALLTSLFRPTLLEVRNPMMFANALETTFVLVTVVAASWRVGPRRLVAAVLSRPPLAFGLVFVLIFGVGVGLASTNLGTLSRYRVPMLPFLAILVFSLGGYSRAASAAEQKRRFDPGGRRHRADRERPRRPGSMSGSASHRPGRSPVEPNATTREP